MRSLKIFAVTAVLGMLFAGVAMAQQDTTTSGADTGVTAPAVDTMSDTVTGSGQKEITKSKRYKKHIAKKRHIRKKRMEKDMNGPGANQ